MDVGEIGVIGGGTMGSGIAQVAAQSGYEVVAAGKLGRKNGEGFYEYR